MIELPLPRIARFKAGNAFGNSLVVSFDVLVMKALAQELKQARRHRPSRGYCVAEGLEAVNRWINAHNVFRGTRSWSPRIGLLAARSSHPTGLRPAY